MAPAVFVHVVPDTHRLWDKVRACLGDDAIALDLPGFDSHVPDGFGATKDEYVDWLIDRISAIGEPVDIVGHDWGSILVQRLVCVRPDLVRTWAAGGGPVHADYVWHDTAKIWQTPQAGEEFMRTTFDPDTFRMLGTGMGIPDEDAAVAADHIDDGMKDCILKLYRSAVDVGAEWGPDMSKAPDRGLLIWGADDPFVPADFATKTAAVTGADTLIISDCGHWWPVQRPNEVAEGLRALWASGRT